ncbi:MAG: hypothetical protein ABIL09_07985, partial [Gemmatimonadota bacterium]
MANTYVDPNFNIDTSCNVADLTTIKGGAPDADDKIYIYNGATLTVESALACLLISLGETSAGAAADGQRRGNLTIDAGVTITFTGNATATNSGIKSNPASAPGTANESKSNTLTVNGTVANPVVLTNSAGAYNVNNLWLVAMYYGIVAAWDNVTLQYCGGNAASTPFMVVAAQALFTVSTSVVLGVWQVVTGDIGFSANILMPRYAATIPINMGRLAVDASAISTDYRGISVFVHNTNNTAGVEGTFAITPPAAKVFYWRLDSQRVSDGTAWYSNRIRWSSADIRPTVTVPAGLALADPSPTADGELVLTWTNAASYAAGDKVVVYNASGDAVLAILDATAGTGRICGLTNATAYTVYAKATSDNYIFSAASSNVGPTTCTGTDTPDVGN